MKATIRNLLLALTCALLMGAQDGCQTTTKSTSSAPQTKPVEYRLPILTPVEPEKQLQTKDGIQVSVTGYSYSARKTIQRTWRAEAAYFVLNDEYPVEMKEDPFIITYPRELRFRVKVHNQLERVLRLAGTVVSLQVAGKTTISPKADDFLNGIILPRQEGEYEIVGPALNSIGDNATVAVLLYDVVTETDAAGNPTKRSNFEFYFTLSRQNRTENIPIKIEKKAVSRGLYESLRRRAPNGEWVSMPEFDRLLN